MGRPKKENSLTRQDVIEAAIACVEKEGESALGVNRVARELGIKPPAIYKHLDGNSELRKAVVLAIWQKFFVYFKQQTLEFKDIDNPLKIGSYATRNFARLHPEFYKLMMQFQLNPNDPEALLIIRESQTLFRTGLKSNNLSENKLIDIMRMISAALSGFIRLEQGGMLTLDRSTDDSFETMLDALIVAIEYIKAN